MSDDHNIPGQLIEQLLASKGWSKKILALILKMDPSYLNKIILGDRPVDASLALILGDVFEVDPEDFLRLQQSFDLKKARLISKPDPQRLTRARVFGDLPVNDMIKRGWLQVENPKDVPRVEEAIAKFFDVASLAEITTPAHAAKKTEVGKETTLTQAAWLHRVRTMAAEMLVPTFSLGAVRDAIASMRRLLLAAEEARHVPRILAEAGVRFMLVEALPGTKIDGVCTWIEDAPVIALSLRHDRVDNFWFVLRHELEHILRGDGKTDIHIDVELDRPGDDLPPSEQIANNEAAAFCVPQVPLKQFIARKDPYFAERDIIGFAKTHNIHAGLVAGQLQYQTKRYDRFRQHQVKIRTIVAPSATVDGWGDVAPVDL